MGKTRLAIAVAEALAERPGFPDGIFFVSLAKTAAPELLPSALAAVLNINLGGVADPAAQLVTFLRPMRALLVLDNFEHLLDGIDLVLYLLEEAPGLRLLVTSREALNVRGEERFVLGGLEEEAGAALFTGAAARVQPGYVPGPTDQAAIRAIVRDVGGMPLAVELAATWIRLMDAPAIAARIRADLDFLSTNLRDLPERQRSMRAVFDYMWQTLSSQEREALAMLSVLRGPFRLDAAEAIAGASPETLAILLDQSLLRAAGGGRFELHELLRQYGAARLAADPEREAAAHARHAGHYLAVVARSGELLNGPESKEGLAALLRNLDNVRAAWRYVTAHGRADEIIAAARSLEIFYRFSGLMDEGVASLATAAATLVERIERGELAAADGYPVVYELWRYEALIHELRGDGATALDRLSRARDGWTARGNQRQLSAVLSAMGYVNLRRSQFDLARPLLDEALALGRVLEDDGLIAAALHNQGNAASWTGDFMTGRTLLLESIERYRAAGERRWLLGALNDLGVAYVFAGDIENGRSQMRLSLTLAETYGDQPSIAQALSNLGAIALDMGDLDEAEMLCQRAIAVTQDIGDRLFFAVSVGNLGHVALARGRLAAATRLYRDSVTLCGEGGFYYMLIEVVVGLAALAVLGDTREARAGTRWLAAVHSWRVASGLTMEMAFVRGLRERTEAEMRSALRERFDAAWAEGLALPLETVAAEATAWAMEEGLTLSSE
jgi:predicted ATPase